MSIYSYSKYIQIIIRGTIEFIISYIILFYWITQYHSPRMNSISFFVTNTQERPKQRCKIINNKYIIHGANGTILVKVLRTGGGTINSKINGTPKGVHLLISKLHSSLVVAN